MRSRLYRGWLEVAGHFGEVQTLLIICFVYVFVMGPMALIAAVMGRDLLAKRGFEGANSVWCDADSTALTRQVVPSSCFEQPSDSNDTQAHLIVMEHLHASRQ